MRTALTIAGSDSGGGAGIQADLKTFAAHGVYGTSAITAVTAQNTLGVAAWQALPADLVTAQIEAVAGDIGADAVKIGMLANAAIVEAVAAAIAEPRSAACRRRSGDGRQGRRPPARATTRSRRMRLELLPLAHVVTPNIPEAEVLAGMSIASLDDMRRGRRERILELGPARRTGEGRAPRRARESIDVALHAGRLVRAPRPRGSRPCTRTAPAARWRRRLPRTWRSGSTTATAIDAAPRVPRRRDPPCPGIGRGHGPLGHFWRVVY